MDSLEMWILFSVLFCVSGQAYAQECETCVCCDVGKDLCLKGENCITCLDGYYGGVCKSRCPSNCIECEKEPVRSGNGQWPNPILYHVCTKCIDSKYSGETNETKNCSLTCPSECETCTSATSCGKCKSGYYLDTGACISCNPKCSTCRSISDCISCVSGYYGKVCENKCSVGCQGASCFINGTCKCKMEFDGDKCDQCSNTYFGQNCEFKCWTLCLNQLCDGETGICEHCLLGRFGEFCNQTCSSGCKSGVCSREGGICYNGCLATYSGEKCCVQNLHCMECSSTTACATCVNGYFGNQCEHECSEMCKDGCMKTNGECNGCLGERYGITCEYNCSNCLSDRIFTSACSQSQGECLFGCEEGFYGLFCQHVCNTTCIDKTCDRLQGLCLQAEGNEKVTCDDSVKNIVVAVVVTFVLSIALTAGAYCLFRFIRSQNSKGPYKQTERLTKGQTDVPTLTETGSQIPKQEQANLTQELKAQPATSGKTPALGTESAATKYMPPDPRAHGFNVGTMVYYMPFKGFPKGTVTFVYPDGFVDLTLDDGRDKIRAHAGAGGIFRVRLIKET